MRRSEEEWREIDEAKRRPRGGKKKEEAGESSGAGEEAGQGRTPGSRALES